MVASVDPAGNDLGAVGDEDSLWVGCFASGLVTSKTTLSVKCISYFSDDKSFLA